VVPVVLVTAVTCGGAAAVRIASIDAAAGASATVCGVTIVVGSIVEGAASVEAGWGVVASLRVADVRASAACGEDVLVVVGLSVPAVAVVAAVLGASF
jgi:hypothetical protein